ncbi:MAG: LytTR family DNA-binding domain-containing protein [Oscillospiraceae bacterium]|nr:LytTR family DNA-binding domain-containing protein [Oscillospiraceae bacterium]
MLNIAVVDDDLKFLAIYIKIITEAFSKNKVSVSIQKFSSGSEFISSVNDRKYDLIFMDIDMPELSGIDIAAEMRKRNSNLDIIFVSAHPHFVFEAIKFNPYRYIRKSNLSADTYEAIDSYCSRTKSNKNMISLELQNGNTVNEKANDIVSFFTVRHDVFYNLINNKEAVLLSRKYSLSMLESITESYGFIRVHKSYLINYKGIKSINSKSVLLINNTEIPISRGKKNEIQEQFMELLRNEVVQ